MTCWWTAPKKIWVVIGVIILFIEEEEKMLETTSQTKWTVVHQPEMQELLCGGFPYGPR